MGLCKSGTISSEGPGDTGGWGVREGQGPHRDSSFPSCQGSTKFPRWGTSPK